MSHIFLRFVFVLVLAVDLSAELEVTNLIEQSPFLPPGYREPPPRPEPVRQPVRHEPPMGNQIEFRGLTEVMGRTQVILFDRKAGRGFLMEANQPQDGADYIVTAIHINEDDNKRSAITVARGGRSERINMHESGGSVRGRAPARDVPVPSSASRPTNPNLRSSSSRGLVTVEAQSSPSNAAQERVSSERKVPRRRIIRPVSASRSNSGSSPSQPQATSNASANSGGLISGDRPPRNDSGNESSSGNDSNNQPRRRVINTTPPPPPGLPRELLNN